MFKRISRNGFLVLCSMLLTVAASGGTNRWTSLGPRGALFGKPVADPSNPGRVYVPTYAGGVFRSDDGVNWEPFNRGLTDESISQLAVYDGALFAASSNGKVLRNEGEEWEAVADFSPAPVSISIDTQTGLLWAVSNGVLQRYDIASREWRHFDPPSRVSRVDAIGGYVLVQANVGPARMYVLDSHLVWVTVASDFFSETSRFLPVAVDRQRKRFVTVNYREGRLMELTGTDGWKDIDMPPLPVGCQCVSDIDVDGSAVAVSVGALKFVYEASSRQWLELAPTAAVTYALLVTPTAYYASSAKALFVAPRTDGEWRSLTDSFAVPHIYDVTAYDDDVFATTSDGIFTSKRNAPFALVDRSGPAYLGVGEFSHRLFAAFNEAVVWTDDFGATWHSAGLPPEYDATVYGMAIDHGEVESIYIVSNAGVLRLQGPSGKWEELPQLPFYDYYSARIDTNPVDGSVYLASDGLLYHYSDGSWKSMGPIDDAVFAVASDGRVMAFRNGRSIGTGYQDATWTAGGSIGALVTALAFDPTNADVAYAGASDGTIYRTTNGGATWTRFGDERVGPYVSKFVFDRSGAQIYVSTANGVYHYAIDDSYLARAGRYSVALQTAAGNFVGVGADDRVTANGRSEFTFTLYDVDGGSLQDGDVVHLRTSRGDFVMAEGGGANDCAGCDGALMANRQLARAWESFVVRRLAGTGEITSGDQIALVSRAGNFVAAENGGSNSCDCDSLLRANRSAAGPWESFTLIIH